MEPPVKNASNEPNEPNEPTMKNAVPILHAPAATPGALRAQFKALSAVVSDPAEKAEVTSQFERELALKGGAQIAPSAVGPGRGLHTLAAQLDKFERLQEQDRYDAIIGWLPVAFPTFDEITGRRPQKLVDWAARLFKLYAANSIVMAGGKTMTRETARARMQKYVGRELEIIRQAERKYNLKPGVRWETKGIPRSPAAKSPAAPPTRRAALLQMLVALDEQRAALVLRLAAVGAEICAVARPPPPPPSGTSRPPEFRAFVAGLLARIGLTSEHVAKYTADAGDSEKWWVGESPMGRFSRAFTHETYDAKWNYERYEFVGDSIVNNAVASHLAYARFPDIPGVKWLTRLKHNLMSKKTLARLAYDSGFLPHIRCDGVVAEMMRRPVVDLDRCSKDFLSVLEDTFEAFVGALQDVVDSGGGPRIGGMVADALVRSFLDTVDIPLEYELNFDAKTRFKQLCDRYGWSFSVVPHGRAAARDCTMTHRQVGPASTSRAAVGHQAEHIVEVFGYPLHDRRKTPQNRVLLCTVRGLDNDRTQQEAAKRALHILETDFSICEIKSDPYTDAQSRRKAPRPRRPPSGDERPRDFRGQPSRREHAPLGRAPGGRGGWQHRGRGGRAHFGGRGGW